MASFSVQEDPQETRESQRRETDRWWPMLMWLLRIMLLMVRVCVLVLCGGWCIDGVGGVPGWVGLWVSDRADFSGGWAQGICVLPTGQALI